MNYYFVISYGLNQIMLLFKLKAMREQKDETKEGCCVQKINTEDPEHFFFSLSEIIISNVLFKNHSSSYRNMDFILESSL